MKSDDELRAENEAIREMLARSAESRLRAIPGVIHVSVGLKETNGRVTDQLCVRVYVREKRDRAELPDDEIIPREIDGVPTDVNTVGTFEFQVDSTRYRPILGGSQITNRIIAQNEELTATEMMRGTLGCLAIDNTDDAPVLLSNWHVLYAHTGDDGDRIYQPAPASSPPLTLLDLPFRPKDDTDKIAVNRRGKVTNKVDAAIAAVDVSSCCNCCGIEYSNEINGLSVGGKPPRSTIVDKTKAVSGMTVYKVGQSTSRSEGKVVDANHPSFTITKGGENFTFAGQIAIQHVDKTKPFSTRGDSGAVVINNENKIVGLIFAAGQNVEVLGQNEKFVTIANHIDDVLGALNIRIPFSDKIVVNAGEVRSDVVVREAPIPEPYRALRERLLRHENTARLFALGERHANEITYLVNHCKPVTIAWHKNHGPALLATVMSAIRDGDPRLPRLVKGVAPYETVERMRAVLSQYGSAALQAHLARPETAPMLEELKDCTGVDEVIDRLASNETLGALLRRIDS